MDKSVGKSSKEAEEQTKETKRNLYSEIEERTRCFKMYLTLFTLNNSQDIH